MSLGDRSRTLRRTCLGSVVPDWREFRTGLLRICLIGALFVIHCETAKAWNYQEHFAITYDSLYSACKSLPESTDSSQLAGLDARALCSPAAMICMAHMVALAGDYVKSPQDLIADARSHTVLRRGKLDCSGFLTSAMQAAKVITLPDDVLVGPNDDKKLTKLPQCVAPQKTEGFKWTDEIEKKLIRNPIRTGYRWATLATRNAQHFQPASYYAYREFEKDANSPALYSPEERIAYHAFALHFLEDSFAAGHVGLDRLASAQDADPSPFPPPRSPPRAGSYALGLAQDYAHAYHDDMNLAGQGLQTKPSSNEINDNNNTEDPWWFGYGDTQLCAQTIYLYVPPQTPGSPAPDGALLHEVLAAVNAGEINEYQDKTFKDEAIKAIEQTPTRSKYAPPIVFSLPGRRLGSFLQVSIASAFTSSIRELAQQFAVCSWSQYCAKVQVVLTGDMRRDSRVSCQKETLAGEPGYFILRCLESSEHVVRAAMEAQNSFLAALQHDAVGSDSAYGRAIADLPYNYSSNDPYKHAKGAPALNLEKQVLTYGEFEAVNQPEPRLYESWGPSLSHFAGSGLSETLLSFGPSLGLEDCAACNVDVRFGVLSWHDGATTAPFNTAISSFIYNPIPPKLGRVVTGNLRLEAGFQALWDGGERRNVFGGGGFGLEIPFGRYVIQLGATHDFHWNSHLHAAPTTTFAVGVRIPSVSLSRSKPS